MVVRCVRTRGSRSPDHSPLHNVVLFSILRAFWQMLEPRRRWVFSALVFAMLTMGVFEMAGMLVIFGFIRGISANPGGTRSGPVGQVLERGLERLLTDQEFALLGGALVLGVILIKNLQSMLVRYQVSRFLSNLDRRISTQIFAALLRMPYERIVTTKDPPRAILQKTVDVLSDCFSASTQILADAALLSMVIALLVFVDPWLTLGAVLAFGGLGTLIYRQMQKLLRRMGKNERKERKRAARTAGDAFRGIVPVRLRDNIGYFVFEYTRSLGKSLKVQRKKGALGRVPSSANELLLTSCVVGAVGYLVLSGKNMEEALPILGVFGFAGLRANRAMSRINASFQQLRIHGDEFEIRLRSVLEFAPEVMGQEAVDVTQSTYLAEERPLPPGVDGRFREEISLEDVCFTYQGSKAPAVQNVTLKIPRGGFVSFCGESGSGKSTILLLIMGLLRATEGQVLCDGRNVNHHVRIWQKGIGYVGQSAYLSGGTVVENVAFGVAPEKVDMGKVWRALELAAAKDFVLALPHQENTNLRDGGERLSGGQRQRIVIARALYHDPDIVVFDEATAALDNLTEREITDELLRLKGGKTIICVAHRLTTIKDSDTIHFVHDGRVADSGTYEELLSRNEQFRRLAQHEKGTTSAGRA